MKETEARILIADMDNLRSLIKFPSEVGNALTGGYGFTGFSIGLISMGFVALINCLNH